MNKRTQRLRREYLFKKSNESKEKLIHQRKSQLKSALESGTSLSRDLKNDESLKHELLMDDEVPDLTSHVDDEYARAGINDPKVLITTSRDPSSRLQIFSKEMKLLFPHSQRINRGNYVMKDIVETCRANDVTDLIILHEHRGQPDGMIVSHFPYGPTAYFTLHNTVLRHDVPDQGTVSEQFPHLVFENFSSSLGKRFQDILKYLFPVPKPDGKRVLTFFNQNDFISFRHHVFYKIGKQVELTEVGPRFEMQPYEIRLGLADADDADVEWTFRPHHRTAKKRLFL